MGTISRGLRVLEAIVYQINALPGLYKQRLILHFSLHSILLIVCSISVVAFLEPQCQSECGRLLICTG